MPASNFDAVFYVREPPVISLSDGLFHVCYRIGEHARFEVVMSPHVFFRARRTAGQVVQEFEAGANCVVKFPEAASA